MIGERVIKTKSQRLSLVVKSNQQFMFAVLVLGMISLYRGAEMSEDVNKKIREVLNSSSDFAMHTEDIIRILSSCDILKDHKVIEHLGLKESAAFFYLTKDNQNFIAKVRKTTYMKLHSCDKSFYIDKLVEANVSYLIKDPEYKSFSGNKVEGVGQFFYCVSIEEKADSDLSQTSLFSVDRGQSKKENSAQLFS